MKTLFYTSGKAGSGRLVRGISIGNAVRRLSIDCEYVIMSSSDFGNLAEGCGFRHVMISSESEENLSVPNFRESELYRTIMEEAPDVLLVDLLWFSMFNFIDELECRKIFICHQVVPQFFSIPPLQMFFNPGQYDHLVAIESFESEYIFEDVNPIVLKNRDEILSREEALEKLSLDGDKKNALLAINARPGDFERIKEKYSYLDDEGYHITYSTNYKGGLFPVIDYFNAFDLVICLAGYNQFYECRYFMKEAIFDTIDLHFSSMEKRINECSDLNFEINGADQFVERYIING